MTKHYIFEYSFAKYFERFLKANRIKFSIESTVLHGDCFLEITYHVIGNRDVMLACDIYEIYAKKDNEKYCEKLSHTIVPDYSRANDITILGFFHTLYEDVGKLIYFLEKYNMTFYIRNKDMCTAKICVRLNDFTKNMFLYYLEDTNVDYFADFRTIASMMNSIYGLNGHPGLRGGHTQIFEKTNKENDSMRIVNVIFNGPATIVMWGDGTKTVVKCENETFDPEKGLAMAICKKFFGNNGSYYDQFKKWIPEDDNTDLLKS